MLCTNVHMDGSFEDDQKVHSNMCNIWQSCHWVFDEKTTVCTLIKHFQSMYIQIIFKNDLYTSCIDCLPLIATKSLDVQWDYDDMEYNSLKKKVGYKKCQSWEGNCTILSVVRLPPLHSERVQHVETTLHCDFSVFGGIKHWRMACWYNPCPKDFCDISWHARKKKNPTIEFFHTLSAPYHKCWKTKIP
jgi:hypothetical protein